MTPSWGAKERASLSEEESLPPPSPAPTMSGLPRPKVKSPPPVGCGWEGRASSIGLGARGQLRPPVRRRGRARWRTV